MAGALVQRQQATMSGLQDEASMAYQRVSSNNPLATNLPDRSAMGADAFRHAYASARATQEYGESVANFLGRGVEWMAAASRENNSENFNARDIGMDLHNNRVGREIANELGPKASSDELRGAIERAAQSGRLILSTEDPRAMQEYNKQPDMQALNAVYDAAARTKDAVAEGVQSARDLLNDAGSAASSVFEAKDKTPDVKDNLLDSLKDAFKDAVEKVPDSGFFKFSEAQLESGESFAQSSAPASEAAGALQELVSAREGWEMAASEFENSGASRDGGSRSVLDDPSIQERVAEASHEREMELEMEANMDA